MPLDRRRFLETTTAAAAGISAGALAPPPAAAAPPAGETAGGIDVSPWAPPADPRYRSRLKIGLFTWPFNDKPLRWVLEYAQGLKLQMLELGTGNDPGDAHCPLDELLADGGKRRAYRQQLEAHGLGISSFSCHGNPLDPRPAVARRTNEVYLKTLRLAQMMDVPVVNYFSGCPGDDKGGQRPNWVTSRERGSYVAMLKWQWEERVIPYWRTAAAAARQHQIHVALEFDPGYSVYNFSSLQRLRDAVGGDYLGCNLDFGNIFAMGVDGPALVRKLGETGVLFNFHAKDATIDPHNAEINGLIDVTPYSDVLHRSWSYAICGYGHDDLYWRRILATMKNVGYDRVLSIEHEDPTTEPVVGVRKSAAFLRPLLLE
ncbi:MAG: sugar phosphate isomerase/epimerase family protein [Terriglobales bacterium]